jgi:uncharacterized delta-60 repeat protein
MKKITIISLIYFILFVNILYSQDGSLDTTFGSNGKVTTTIGSLNDIGGAIAIQPDGKIVVAGYSENSSNADIAIARYNTNGSLDTTFDIDGKVTTDIANSNDYLNAIAIQLDGKIVVAGYTGTGTNSDFAIVRYNSNGSLDTSFDTDGKVTTPIGSAGDFGNAIAIQSDGKILVAGSTAVGASFDFAIVRYNTNGSLDTSFGTSGKVLTDIAGFSDEAYAIVIQSDGKIVVAGSGGNGSNNDFALARYNSDGSLDISFDSDGKLLTPIGITNDTAKSVALQNDGKIVTSGFSSAATLRNFAVARYNSNGGLDTSFGADGIVTTDFGVGSISSGTSMVIQSDEKIIVAGITAINGTNYNYAIARYNNDGSLDTNFDNDGKVITDFGNNLNDYGYAMAIQNDSKIIVAGTSVNSSFKFNFSLARYSNTNLGINNLSQNTFFIFPNPTSNIITVQSENISLENASVTLTNSIGQNILQKEKINTSTINLDISSQTCGVYFLTIENQGKKFTKKIVKN